MKKKRPYLLGSRGLIRFFVIVKLERADSRLRKHLLTDVEAPGSSKPTKRSRTEEGVGWVGAAGLSKTQPDGESIKLELLQDEQEWIPGQPKGKITKASISVYTSKVKPSATGVPTRAVETIVESLVGPYLRLVCSSLIPILQEVWPNKPAGGLTLSWNDLGVKNVPEPMRAEIALIQYHHLRELVATLAADENKVLGAERLQTEVDAENVEIEWTMEPSTGSGDDE